MSSSFSITTLLILLALKRGIFGHCPEHFRRISGVCVNVSKSWMNYCKAQAYCHSIGGELLSGSNFMNFDGKYFPGQPISYWIGLSDLAEERDSSRAGWRWTDGFLSPPSEGLTWYEGDPNGGSSPYNEDCIIIRSKKLFDIRCERKTSVVCQPRSVAGVEKFVSVPILKTSNVHRYEKSFGHCSQSVTDVNYASGCAHKCFILKDGWCASFYFHKQRRECLLILFTDANVQLTPDDGQWKKFLAVRPKS